jgi:hypothetical protein
VNSSGVTVSAPLTLNSSVGVPGIQSYAGDLTGSVLVLDGSNQMKKIQSATADFGVNDTGCASGRRSLFFRRGLLHSTYCQ